MTDKHEALRAAAQALVDAIDGNSWPAAEQGVPAFSELTHPRTILALLDEVDGLREVVRSAIYDADKPFTQWMAEAKAALKENT